jgi:hypothetical protein
MKTKTFDRKLILNKKTIVNLDEVEMAVLKGGGESVFPGYCGPTGITCPACDSNVSCSPEACLTSMGSSCLC